MTEYGDKFVCPVYVNGAAVVSNVDNNGQEFIYCCVNCRLDDGDVCQGDRIRCCNNVKNNSYEVELIRGTKYVKTISRGKDEILASIEVEKIARDYREKVIKNE